MEERWWGKKVYGCLGGGVGGRAGSSKPAGWCGLWGCESCGFCINLGF